MINLEAMLHSIFAEHRLQGEWFNLGDEKVGKILEIMNTAQLDVDWGAEHIVKPTCLLIPSNIDESNKNNEVKADCPFLPEGVTDQVSETLLKLVIDWMKDHRQKLPIAQSKLAQATRLIERCSQKLGKQTWISLLKYWNSTERIKMHESNRGGVTLDLIRKTGSVTGFR